MHITLKWLIGKTESGEAKFYTEDISPLTFETIKDYPCLYYGCYFFNLLNARDIFERTPDEKKLFYKKDIINVYTSEILSQLISHPLKFFFDLNTPITILFDTLGFISFSYTYRIISLIKKIPKEVNQDDIEKIKSILENYRDILPNYQFPDNEGLEYAITHLTHAIEKCTDNINSLAFDVISLKYLATPLQFYNKVFDELKKITTSKLISEYCKYKDGMASGRCFATLITPNGDKYISFSGFFDTEEVTIVSYLNKIAPNTPQDYPLSKFLNTIKQLCSDINANLIQTTLDVKRYIILPDGSIQKSISIGDLINQNSFTKFTKDTYACCERKIFASFNDNIPNGELFIKMEPCGECYLGIKYLIDNGSKIKWSVAIERK